MAQLCSHLQGSAHGGQDLSGVDAVKPGSSGKQQHDMSAVTLSNEVCIHCYMSMNMNIHMRICMCIHIHMYTVYIYTYTHANMHLNMYV